MAAEQQRGGGSGGGEVAGGTAGRCRRAVGGFRERAESSRAGNHTHAQLHDALTLGPSATLALSLQGQQLSGEVLLEEAGGLILAPSGLAVDFGPGATQVAPGNHVHSIGTIDFGSAGVGAWLSEWLAGPTRYR